MVIQEVATTMTIPRATARQGSQMISLGSMTSNRSRLEEDGEGGTFTRTASSSAASIAIDLAFPTPVQQEPGVVVVVCLFCFFCFFWGGGYNITGGIGRS